MATDASQSAIPAPASARFTNGELAVGLATPSGSLTHHFSREFRVEKSGLYLLKLWTAGAGVLLQGTNQFDITPRIVTAANQTIETSIVLRKGVNRIDVQCSSDGEAFFAMLIYHPDRVLYASDASGWVYEVASAPSDDEVPEGTLAALSVFSILPNWADGITERLSYLTDILTSESAAEQPRMLRLHARRTFEAAFMRKGLQRTRLESFMFGIGRRVFLMPLWHEQFRLQAEAGPTSDYVQFPSGTLSLREFMVGDQVFVNNKDPDKFEVLRVGAIDYDLDRLYWETAPSFVWPVGSRIMPLRKARIVDQTQMTAPVDRVGIASLRFELEEPEYRFGASWGHCAPVWLFKINRASDLSFSFDLTTYTADNAVGPVSYTTPGNRTRVSMRSALTLVGRTNVIRFRRFIEMAAGRAGRFYMPTGMQGVVPFDASIEGINLDAQRSGFAEYVQTAQDARSILAFVKADGSEPLYRKVLDVQAFDTFERFTLDAALPVTAVDSIERVQFMVPSRFDQDSFELMHLVDESAAVTTSVVTRSVESGGMPDIDCP